MQAPSLPPAVLIPIHAAVDAGFGFAYAYLFKTDFIWTPVIFGVSNLAHRLLFHSIDKIFSKNALRSHKIYVVTYAIYHASLITSLAYLKIIETTGIAFLSLITTAVLAGRIYWIYRQQPAIT